MPEEEKEDVELTEEQIKELEKDEEDDLNEEIPSEEEEDEW